MGGVPADLPMNEPSGLLGRPTAAVGFGPPPRDSEDRGPASSTGESRCLVLRPLRLLPCARVARDGAAYESTTSSAGACPAPGGSASVQVDFSVAIDGVEKRTQQGPTAVCIPSDPHRSVRGATTSSDGMSRLLAASSTPGRPAPPPDFTNGGVWTRPTASPSRLRTHDLRLRESLESTDPASRRSSCGPRTTGSSPSSLGQATRAGEQQQPDEADDLLIGQSLPVHLGLDEPARQVVTRAGPPGPDVVQGVCVHLSHRRRDGRGRHAPSRLSGGRRAAVRIDSQVMPPVLRRSRATVPDVRQYHCGQRSGVRPAGRRWASATPPPLTVRTSATSQNPQPSASTPVADSPGRRAGG